MGRPPCCDKIGIKKGPWTPEEDIMLVSYVQENGPGNWRAIPKTTGLRRCSKSCRLRWTNYLRPGIKRGSFTDQEEKMIIQLQALLGNKWAAIASYLPERTDNDIKNYWNTHLKKKLKKLENGSGMDQSSSCSHSHSISRGQWERRLQDNITTAKQALHDALSFENTQQFNQIQPIATTINTTTTYASSTENIAKLLKQWVKSPIKSEDSSENSSTSNQLEIVPKRETDLNEAFESLFGFESFESSINDSDDFSRSTSPGLGTKGESEVSDPIELAPLSMLENWLLVDDQGKDYLTNFSFDENPDLYL